MTTTRLESLLDTSVIVAAAVTGHPHHRSARELRDRCLMGRASGAITPQVLLEFFRTVTDPRRVSPPFPSDEACRDMEKYAKVFPVLHPGPGALRVLSVLIAGHKVTRARVFELYMAATAIAAGVPAIWTFNVADFEGLDPRLSVLRP